jgi:Fe-S cluster assembly protein SufD
MSAVLAKAGAGEFYAARFADAQARLPGSNIAWLAAARQEAIAAFARLGFPSTRDEAWKYSNLALLERRQYAPVSAPALADQAWIAQHDVCGGHLMVFINGQFAPALSRVPAGTHITSLAHALQHDAESLRSAITDARAPADGLAALNGAFFADGACIRLAPGTQVEAPIHLLFVAASADSVAHPLNLIVAGEGSRATVIEQHVGANDIAYWTNASTRIRLQTNAALHYIGVLQEGAKAHHTARIEVEQGASSAFTAHCIALGGQFARKDIAVRLAAEHSECTLNGLYVTNGREHVDFHTAIDHLVAHGTSREFFKGVLDGASRAVFNGKVIVHPDAQQTDAQQSNKNLLLSEDAEVDTKPQLEIFADDVKCSHGATIGQLDENQVFYLRARGLSEQAARNVLTYAFCEEIIAQLPIEPLRKHLNQALIERLPDSEKLAELI